MLFLGKRYIVTTISSNIAKCYMYFLRLQASHSQECRLSLLLVSVSSKILDSSRGDSITLFDLRFLVFLNLLLRALLILRWMPKENSLYCFNLLATIILNLAFSCIIVKLCPAKKVFYYLAHRFTFATLRLISIGRPAGLSKMLAPMLFRCALALYVDGRISSGPLMAIAKE